MALATDQVKRASTNGPMSFVGASEIVLVVRAQNGRPARPTRGCASR